MKWKIERLMALAAALALVVGLASTASAQVFTGRVDVTAEDATGGRLPGVLVDLTGPVLQSQTTDATGQAHFLNLPVGTYSVKASIAGFNPYSNDVVQVVSNASTPVSARLTVAGTAETVNVEAATPVLDTKKETTTTNVTYEELQNIPSARDPWVVMQTVPTVYMDRVNVGGGESGQQSNYNAKGAKDTDNTWAIDGVPVTDMGATGSSSFYYNFDSFQEMAVTTGGADAANATGGVQLNMVLKKGTNQFHGNGAFYFENQSLQSNNLNADLNAQAIALGNTTGKGNRIDTYKDRGIDLGGPLLKDKLWAWGQYAQTNIAVKTLSNGTDATLFKTRALKIDGQANTNIRGNFTWYYNDKEKFGRSGGPTRPPETAWNQSGLGGGTKYYKGEGNFVIGQKVFATAKAAYVKGGFQLVPAGGDKDYYQDAAGVWHNSYYTYSSDRPQHYVGGDASYFAGKHEVKIGGAWRSTPVTGGQTYPASGIESRDDQGAYPQITAIAKRAGTSGTDASYTNLFITDTISMDRLTVTGGIRYDHQTSGVAAASVPGVTGIPVLPALDAPANPDVFNWKNITPRIGMTYALDSSRKTLARASYAMFASQLQGSQASIVSVVPPYAYAYYNAIDKNGDHIAQLSEIITTGGVDGKGLQYTYGFDPNNPLKTSNKVDPNVKAPTTHEILLGVDRELAANVSVSGTFTYRRNNDLIWTPLSHATSADYKPAGTLTGNVAEVGAFSVPLYAQTVTSDPGEISTNRPGYHQNYMGVELSLQKRMSNHWMGRFGFASNSWKEYYGDGSILDPTKAPAAYTGKPWAGANNDGGLVVRSSTGSGKSGIYLVAPAYQWSLSGMYEAPANLSFGLNLVSRQGYAEPFYRSKVSMGDKLGSKNVLIVQNVNDFRLPTLTSADARIEWKLKIQRAQLALDLDVFNFMNAGTVLGKQYDARLTGATGFDKVLEIMNPRIARLGARFTW